MTDHCLAGDSAKGRRHRLRGRLGAEWIAAAEEERRKRHGSSMTAEEPGRLLRRRPGAV